MKPLLVEAAKDRQLVRPDWSPTSGIAIEGVDVRPITNVLTDNGYLTEIFRSEWDGSRLGTGQVFQRVLQPGSVSAWHVHMRTTDRLFCAVGVLKLALFDARPDSSTARQIGEIRLGQNRPALVVVPPGIFHGVKNIGTDPCVMVNVVDLAYDYEDPDHWRIPAITDQIPYQF